MSDVTDALAQAAAQANRPGGAPIYVSSALGTCQVSTGVSFERPVSIYGDNYRSSVLAALHDIVVFTFEGGAAGSLVRDLHIVGMGPGATRPGLLFNGCHSTVLDRICVRQFGTGVRYAQGDRSSYLSTVIASQIICNNSVNIDAQAQTHRLALYQVTFGGRPAQIGLRVVDSDGLTVYGGDCEGVSLCCVDLDSTRSVAPPNGGHLISGCDFEANTCSEGDIRVGKTQLVRSVQVSNVTVSPGNTDQWFINPQNCDGLLVSGCLIGAGYKSGCWLNGNGRLTNLVALANGTELDSNTDVPVNQIYNNFGTFPQHPQPWRRPQTFEPKYQGGAAANQYAMESTHLDVPDGRWYAGLDVMNITPGRPPARGARAYARAMIGHNGYGDGLNVGAAYMRGEVEIEGSLGIVGQATTGRETARFTARNKPGLSGTAPAKWLPITLDGRVYYIPCWE